jgi:presenilin-like A22 family membrane protease
MNWLSKKIFILLAGAFFIIELFGLFVAQRLVQLGLAEDAFIGDINNPINAFYLFGIILTMTIIILIIIKFRRQKKGLFIIELLAIFATSTIVFGVFYPTNDSVVLLATLLLIIARYTNKENKWIKNFVSAIAIIGAGSLIGISFGVFPIFLFIIILSIYDFIAVFKTKHMVSIGKAVTKNNFAFTITFPTKKHTFELGNGDLVIPLITSSSVLANGFFSNNLLVALLLLIGSFIGIAFSIYSVSKKKIPLPALPPQTLIMIAIILIAILLRL